MKGTYREYDTPDGYTFYTWMTTEKGLKGLEVLVYAMIYKDYKEYNRPFSCTLRELAHKLDVSDAGVINALNSLISKGLITKEKYYDNEHGSLKCDYSIVESTIENEQ